VRAYAINSVGTNYGADSVFTTLSTVAPTVTTIGASSISFTSATLGGNVSDSGTAAVTERGVVYATTVNPTTANTKVSIGTGLGTFAQVITALTPNTTYHFRAYAINGVGTSYGVDSIFTTLPSPEFNTKITNAFTPDGDGINETWVIDNADMLDGHDITVYNIFGQVVFSQTGYNTPWDGKKDGNLIPSGEYYYHIKGNKINTKGALLIKSNQ
jgi:gliding motility-associated-like protein